MDFSGNQFPFAFGAADNSTNNLANGFAPAGNNNTPFNGAYGNTPIGVPNYGAYHAPPQNVSMGHPGLTQPNFAGMPTSHHSAAAAHGFPMANGHYNAPMPYGMHPGMPMAPLRVQQPAIGFSMAPGHHNTPMFDGMRPYGSSSVALAGSPTVRAMSEQRPAPLVAPANLGNGDAYNALQFPAVAPVPVAPAARPAEVIDLTNEEPANPITPAAGTKRAREDRTPRSSAKPAKRPRYTAFGPYATPSATPTVANIPPVPTTPALSSSASVSDAEVVPATPSPSERPRVPRKRPADPYNLRGDIYYTYMIPKNPQFEENTRPVYSRPEGLPSTSATSKRGRKGKKHPKAQALEDEELEEAVSESTSEPVVSSPETVQAPDAEDGTDVEEDAVFEFEFDEDVIAPAVVTPAAATPAAVEILDAPAAEITFDAAEEEHDDSDDLVFDDDGNVMTDAQGQPIALSVWRAKQAEAAATKPQDEELVLETGAGDLPAAVAAKKDAAPKRPTVSGKKLPSQRPTFSGKKIPSQKPAVSKKQVTKRAPSPVSDDDDDDDLDLEAALQAEFDSDNDDNDLDLEAALQAEFDSDNDDNDLDLEAALQTELDADNESEVEEDSDSDNDEPQPMSLLQRLAAAATQQETAESAESAEDKRALSDLEAKFGDYRQIRVKHGFEALQQALFDVWAAVDCRSGPLRDQWNAMMLKKRETVYEDWEYSEDES